MRRGERAVSTFHTKPPADVTLTFRRQRNFYFLHAKPVSIYLQSRSLMNATFILNIVVLRLYLVPNNTVRNFQRFFHKFNKTWQHREWTTFKLSKYNRNVFQTISPNTPIYPTYICLYVCVSICIYIYISINVCVYINMSIYVYVCIYVCVYKSVICSG